MSYTTHLTPYYVAENLDLADDPQSANIVRKAAAERDLAVSALRRILQGDIGSGDMYMIATEALDWIDHDPSDDPDLCHREAINMIVDLDLDLNDEDEDEED